MSHITSAKITPKSLQALPQSVPNPTSPPCNIASCLCEAGWLKIGSSKTQTKLSFYWLGHHFPWHPRFTSVRLHVTQLKTLVFWLIPDSLFLTTSLTYVKLVILTLESYARSSITSASILLSWLWMPWSVVDWISVIPCSQAVQEKICDARRLCRILCVGWSTGCPACSGF